MDMHTDLLIVGAGPAGLSAAINAASEGLTVRIMDNGTPMGGQARESAAIENYPGFPDGLTGDELMTRIVRQTAKFGVDMVSPVQATRFRKLEDGSFHVVTDDYQDYSAKAVVMSLGVSYRRLEAKNISSLMGRGVFYGRPSGSYRHLEQKNVVIVGGANSAGQAAVKMSENPNTHVQVVIRSKLVDKMSTYLIDRIRNRPNVEVCEDCEVVEAIGKDCLEKVVIRYGDNSEKEILADQMYVYIGAIPRTLWLDGCGIELDKHRFIVTDPGFQTNLKGCFAVGDIRSGSVKRIASACGEGSQAVPSIHRYLSGV